MQEGCQRHLTRPEVLNTVFQERPKMIAMGWSMLGNGRAAERVFRELLTALDERSEQFPDEEALQAWCWKALRNRCLNLVQRGDGRRVMLSEEILERADEELRARNCEEVADQAEALEVCMGKLSQRSRWTIHLFYTKGKGGLEAARMLNVPPEQLYRDLQRIYVGGAECLLKRIAMGRTPLGRVRSRSTEFERLVFRYLDDELTEERVRHLGEMILKDSDRIRQFNDIRMYSVLIRDSSVLDAGSEHSLIPPASPVRRPAVSVVVSLVVAAVIVGALGGGLALIKLNPEQPPTAIFERGAGAKFAIREAPQIGAALDSEKYVLTAGVIQLRFPKRTEVNIEAPAAFRIDSEDRLFLEYGTLLATVPQEAIGFEVATKFGTIRDLGTEFGVTVQSNRSAEVVVFRGLVEISGHGARTSRIHAGDGKLVTSDEIKDVDASAVAFRYTRTLPSSDAACSSTSLANNFSFEDGPLSRAPYASHRYRDLPSHWLAGYFGREEWRNQVGKGSNVGTAVVPFKGSDDLFPPHGERCLYAERAAVRQPIGGLRPGGRYSLKFLVASPAVGEKASSVTYEVGFLSDGQWIESERGTVTPGAEFTTVEHTLTIPKGVRRAGKPLHLDLVLSAKDGLVFFDEVQLMPASGEK